MKAGILALDRRGCDNPPADKIINRHGKLNSDSDDCDFGQWRRFLAKCPVDTTGEDEKTIEPCPKAPTVMGSGYERAVV